MRLFAFTSAISIAAHVALALWAISQLDRPPEKRHIDLSLAEIRRAPEPKKIEPQPEPEPEPPKPRPVRKVKQLVEQPKVVEPPPAAEPPKSTEEPPKIGVDESALADSGIAVASGVSLEGRIGTGTSMEKPKEPQGTPDGMGRGRRTVPIYAVTRLPKPRRLVEPEVPAAFRSSAREIVVVVEVEIDTDGRVIAARIVRNVGFGLDEAALTAAKNTEWEPALVGTQPVPVRYQIPYRIRVRG
jgi:periplasmic protein TonB